MEASPRVAYVGGMTCALCGRAIEALEPWQLTTDNDAVCWPSCQRDKNGGEDGQ